VHDIALFFAAGESLYPGSVLLLCVLAASPIVRNSWQRRVRNILAWLGLCLMVVASPPVSPLTILFFILLFLVWMIYSNRTAGATRESGIRPVAAILLTVLTVVVTRTEYLQRRMPHVSGARADHLVVIGDSISAGIDPAIAPWPTVFQTMTNIPVKNLALPGAEVNEGPYMAAKVNPEDHLIVIELGGNDLLANEPGTRFEKYLGETLQQLARPDRTLVMFELPLLPHKTNYGEIQRRLAAKYHVWLIPKRKFIGVLRGADATTDGIHLSSEGARHMSLLVKEVLAPVLKPLAQINFECDPRRAASIWPAAPGSIDLLRYDCHPHPGMDAALIVVLALR
jgi:lysophospholipase L1-like esterase